MTDSIYRSALFVPGYKDSFLQRSLSSNADALLLDVEDSVPDAFKEDARRLVHQFLEDAAGNPVAKFCRVNSIDSGMLRADLDAIVGPSLTGIMPSKAYSEADIHFLDRLLLQYEIERGLPAGAIKMMPLIETAKAVVKAFDIAVASPRIIGLALGGEDYLTDLDGLHKEHGTSLLYPRSAVVVAARAARVQALDTPYLDVADLTGYCRELEQSRELGFSGQLVLHPTQVADANRIFSPSADELKQAMRVIEAIAASRAQGSGVTLLDGKLVGPPMLKRAHAVVEKHRRLQS
jgi:citrate lyase subunit beta/citryl-CoA lyase